MRRARDGRLLAIGRGDGPIGSGHVETSPYLDPLFPGVGRGHAVYHEDVEALTRDRDCVEHVGEDLEAGD